MARKFTNPTEFRIINKKFNPAYPLYAPKTDRVEFNNPDPALATSMTVSGLGKLNLNQIKRISIQRGLYPQEGVATINFGAANSTNTVTNSIHLSFKVYTLLEQGEMDTPRYEGQQQLEYAIKVTPGMTPSAIATAFATVVNNASTVHQANDPIIKATVNLATVTLTINNSINYLGRINYFFKPETLEVMNGDTFKEDSLGVDITMAETVKPVRSNGWGYHLEPKYSAMYSNKADGCAPEMASTIETWELYTMIFIEWTSNLTSRVYEESNEMRWLLMVNETKAEALIDDIITFLTSQGALMTGLVSDGVKLGFVAAALPVAASFGIVITASDVNGGTSEYYTLESTSIVPADVLAVGALAKTNA